MTKKELQKEVAKMAKRANTRLREIEKKELTKASVAYRYIETESKDKQSYLSKTKKGEIKFDTSLSKKSYNELKEEYAKLNTFLNESKTSTVRGVKNHYKSIYDTFIQNHPNSKMTFNQFGDMWRSGQIDKALRMFSSEQAVNIYQSEDNNLVDKVLESMDETTATYSDFLRELEKAKEITTN